MTVDDARMATRLLLKYCWAEHDDRHVNEKQDNSTDGGFPDQAAPEDALPPDAAKGQQQYSRRTETQASQ